MPRDYWRRWRLRRSPDCAQPAAILGSEVQAADSVRPDAGLFGNCPEGYGNRRHLRVSGQYPHRQECARHRIVESLTGLKSQSQYDITCTTVAEAEGGSDVGY